MTGNKKTHTCFTCNNKFQMEKHKYDGKWIQVYQIEVCIDCWHSNWDGWTPHFGNKIIEYLKEKGLQIPPMNEKGFLPRS